MNGLASIAIIGFCTPLMIYWAAALIALSREPNGTPGSLAARLPHPMRKLLDVVRRLLGPFRMACPRFLFFGNLPAFPALENLKAL